jgi:protein-tyrosine phosphatase
MSADKVKVVFVCLGNICRSPLAEGVFRHMVHVAGLGDRFEIDSAGTSSYHIGDPPDSRTAAVARSRGVELSGAARQFTARDLAAFDYVIAMDEDNLANVRKLASARSAARIHLLREFDHAVANEDRNVPDPYYGGPRGFEDVHDIVERSCAELLKQIRKQHSL